MANQETQKNLYSFLAERLKDQAEFTKHDVLGVTGWKIKSLNDYFSKQLKAYIRKLPNGKLRVKRSFARFGTFAAFQPLVTQVKHPISRYKRTTYNAVVQYEFLLPLTQENKLRIALDELFYKDTVEALVRDLADDALLDGAIPALDGESAEQHLARAIAKISDFFWGYSISHVDGRFRAAQIATRQGAAEQLVQHERYLVDETTAVVRFIFPCSSSREEHGNQFDLQARPLTDAGGVDELYAEIRLVRGIFFSVFVEAIAMTVQGEDIIWLLEDSPLGRRLYELGNAKEETRDAAQVETEGAADSNESE